MAIVLEHGANRLYLVFGSVFECMRNCSYPLLWRCFRKCSISQLTLLINSSSAIDKFVMFDNFRKD